MFVWGWCQQVEWWYTEWYITRFSKSVGTKKPHISGAYLCILAERQGFEPWVGINLRWFSRPVHSTALSSLQDAK